MNQEAPNNIDFSVDVNNLYREESITDMRVASIRRLVPIKSDGTDDPERKSVFIGHTQIMSEQGPLPLQAPLDVESFDEAFEAFPAAMQVALEELVEKVRQMQREQEIIQPQTKSNIIVPGR